eukprot:TRINITY_DN775832_c0_g1_i1.p1 TRINITY_DN775832_c0_g1~~TRINITY_DN775832_c0_g1_i1.p1  ORF type:complete len:345 (-),score=99.66 TRINITY_DN775832_c0_g1_i1:161-1195(-)
MSTERTVYEFIVEPNDPADDISQNPSESDPAIESDSIDPVQAFKTISESKVVSSGVFTPEESPLEKLQRLKNEVYEFEEEMKVLSSSQSSKDTITNQCIQFDGIFSDITKMSAALQSISTKGEYQNLLQQTSEEFNVPKELISNKTASTTILRTSQNSSAHIFELERRLTELERAIGSADSNLAAEPSSKKSDTVLVDRLDSLEQQVSLLDETKLKHFSKQLKLATAEMNEALKSHETTVGKAKGLDRIKNKQLNESFKILQQWDPFMQRVPAIAERMNQLEALHKEAATVCSRVAALEEQDNLIEAQLSKDERLLKQVQQSIEENSKIMQKNLEVLGDRIMRR